MKHQQLTKICWCFFNFMCSYRFWCC